MCKKSPPRVTIKLLSAVLLLFINCIIKVTQYAVFLSYTILFNYVIHVLIASA